jgi:hypothetical protein
MNLITCAIIYTFSALPDTLSAVKADTLFIIKKTHDFISADRLDNIYVINDDVITRYQSNGDSLLQQSFKNFGNVEVFDATQALRPVLFYTSQSLVVTVDNTLSIQNQPIDLTQWQFEQCTLLAASNLNNGFWLFDNGTLELLRTDHTYKIINRSGNISTALNIAAQPQSMKENNNRLYMYIKDVGIAVFDQYANYLKTLPINELTSFEVYGDMIYYVYKGNLYQYDMKNFNTWQVTNNANLVSFAVNANRLYLGNGSLITVVIFR